MNRRKSTALVLTGLALVMATFVGVFALLTDTADTGQFALESEAQAESINLRIAQQGLTGTMLCSDPALTYADNSTFDITFDDVNPGSSFTRFICVRNTGEVAADVSLELFDRSSTEIGCTGDEPEVDTAGGPDCGPGGELAARTDVTVHLRDSTPAGGIECDVTLNEQTGTFDGIPNTPATAFGQIQPGSAACYRVTVTYDPATTDLQRTIAQTDRAAWKFKFHGAAA